jgi:glycosyltransferase 2 family protein
VIRSFVGLAISAALLTFFFRSLDVGSLIAPLGHLYLPLLVPAVGVYFFGIWLRAVRWKWLIAPYAQVSAARLFRVVTIGVAANFLLPFRLGEVVRSFLLRNSNGVPIASSLASILVERLFDIITLCGLMIVGSLLVPLSGWLSSAITFCWLVIGGTVCVAAVLLVASRTPRGTRLPGTALLIAVDPSGRISGRLSHLVASFLGGLRVVETPRALGILSSLSVACWAADFYHARLRL